MAEAERCVDCGSQEWSFPKLDGLVSYQEPGGELLRLYKFGGNPGLAGPWARASALRINPKGPFVPVPPSPKTLRHRGWDPVETITRALGRQTGLPVWKALSRNRAGIQKNLDREARMENARRAFRLNRRFTRRLEHVPLVWLVDDVVTTGATVEACSRLLRDAGVREVRVFCLGLH